MEDLVACYRPAHAPATRDKSSSRGPFSSSRVGLLLPWPQSGVFLNCAKHSARLTLSLLCIRELTLQKLGVNWPFLWRGQHSTPMGASFQQSIPLDFKSFMCWRPFPARTLQSVPLSTVPKPHLKLNDVQHFTVDLQRFCAMQDASAASPGRLVSVGSNTRALRTEVWIYWCELAWTTRKGNK